jgi:hypothetical protein
MDMNKSNFTGQLTKNNGVGSVKLNKIREYCILSADVIFELKNKHSSVKLTF